MIRLYVVLAALGLLVSPARAQVAPAEVTCFAASREVFHGRPDPRFPFYSKCGTDATFTDAADGRQKHFPSCMMVWGEKK